jgi:hypothetical protein
MSATGVTRSRVQSCSQSIMRWYARWTFTVTAGSRAIKVDSRLRVHSPSRSSAAMHTSSTAVVVARLPAIKLADSALLPMHRGTCFSCLRWLLMSWQRARWRGCLEALEGAAHHVRLACVAISCRRPRGPRRKPHERRSWRSPRWAPRCPPCSEFLFQSV